MKLGSLVTSDLKVSGTVRFWLNAEGLSPQSRLRVELLDRFERPIPKYSGDRSALVEQSGFRVPMVWSGRPEIGDLTEAFKIKLSFEGPLRGAVSFYAVYVSN